MLRGAGAAAGGAAVGAFALAAPASANDSRDDGRPSASWLIVRQDDGSPDTITGVLSFAAGNVVIEHDINPAGPPFTGTWAAVEDNRFRATFWSGEAGQGPGQPGPTVRVRLRGRVNHGSLTATYTFTAFDPSTGAAIQTGTGKVLSGQRIAA